MSCALCGGPEQIGHHVSYDPERRVPVCRSCHSIIHSHRSEHSLLPEYMPISRTRTKQGVKTSISSALLARLETMVEDRGLCDINQAINELLEEGAAEMEDGREYVWNMRKYETETIDERFKRVRDAMDSDS